MMKTEVSNQRLTTFTLGKLLAASSERFDDEWEFSVNLRNLERR